MCTRCCECELTPNQHRRRSGGSFRCLAADPTGHCMQLIRGNPAHFSPDTHGVAAFWVPNSETATRGTLGKFIVSVAELERRLATYGQKEEFTFLCSKYKEIRPREVVPLPANCDKGRRRRLRDGEDDEISEFKIEKNDKKYENNVNYATDAKSRYERVLQDEDEDCTIGFSDFVDEKDEKEDTTVAEVVTTVAGSTAR